VSGKLNLEQALEVFMDGWASSAGMPISAVVFASGFALCWREACTVRSVEELDALPTYSLIRDIEDGTVWENHNGRWVWLIGPFHAQERKPLQHSPALVLYRPDWDTP